MPFDLKEYRRLQTECANAHFDSGEWTDRNEPPFGEVADKAETADAALESYVLAHVIQP